MTLVCGPDCEDNVGELTATASLLLVHLTVVDSRGQGFFVLNLRRTLIAFHLKLTPEAVNNNLKVKLTHTRDNGLASLFVGMHAERWILFCQFGKRHSQFIDICLGLWLYCKSDNWLREAH